VKIERFEIPGLAQYSYVISDAGKAVVIDAIRDVDRYTAYASRMGLKITHILETHIHADFAAGSAALAEATGAELALSGYDAGERFVYAMPHRALKDGDSVEIGKLRLDALHTPGHTPEHLSFLLFDLDRSTAEPLALFSGDFLFAGSLGRPDLLGEEAKLGLAHELYKSLQERIAGLHDGVQIYPGHGAGSLCGSGMSERSETTLGYERATDPYFRYGEAVFVDRILESVPEMPAYYPRMKELNAKGAEALRVLPGGKALSARDLEWLRQGGIVTLLDLRRPEAFGGAHIAGSINIGAGQNLSIWAGWLLDAKRPIALIGEQGDDEESRRALVRVGLDALIGYLDGGMARWIDAGLEFARTMQKMVAEVDAERGEALVLDVRSDQERAEGSIPGSQHVTLGELPRAMGGLEKSRPVITVCGTGYRSSIAASLLAREGFRQVSSMDGGMNAWTHRGLPVE
jgi:hydroxyacylglutathione hydrolase